MPIDLYKNQQIYDIVAEGEIAELLSNYNSDFIFDMINDHISKRFYYNPSTSTPNIVSSFELNFKDLASRYPSDADNIEQVRYETYLKVIDIICKSFNLEYVGNNPNVFNVAFYLYDFLVSGYSRNVINFFANYIYHNKDTICNAMDLYDKYKKDKSSSMSYIKKVYNDNTIAIIISRIKEVIYYISGFDIDIYTFLSFNYPKHVCDFIVSNVLPKNDIFKQEFCRVIEMPTLLTDIRFSLQKMIPINKEELNKEIIYQDTDNEEDNSIDDSIDTEGGE